MKLNKDEPLFPRLGFTLVEVMIVVAIIGLLASIIVPNFLASRQRAWTEQVRANLHAIREGIDTQNLISGTYPSWSDVSDNNGRIISASTMPDNPFSTQNKWQETSPRNIVYNRTGFQKGTLAAGGGLGWCYSELTGEFWANTRTQGVNENEF